MKAKGFVETIFGCADYTQGFVRVEFVLGGVVIDGLGVECLGFAQGQWPGKDVAAHEVVLIGMDPK